MARYSVRIKTSAAKELEAVEPRSVRQALVARIETLADDPRPRGCEKLAGGGDRYRVRQGRHRVVYAIDDGPRRVVVVKIGHRREVYR